MPKAYQTFQIKPKLPAELTRLQDIAYNLLWTWNSESIELFRQIDRELWFLTNHNPVKMLGKVKQEILLQLAQDEGFIATLDRVFSAQQTYLTDKTWFDTEYGKMDSPKIAYFSMEFGLTECLPIYSGGLGILAGDHLKSASELGLPLAGMGLLYQKGYFQQYLNADGWQQETYPDNDFYNLPLSLETDEQDLPLLVEIPFPKRTVYARIWRAQVGRIPLYLLDTNTPENSAQDRKITRQLYGGDQETRIQQEFVLGIGGMMALRMLNIHVHVCHMNEGHAAFMALERIRHRIAKDGLSPVEAIEVVSAGTIFTTHTPVPAGIDRFPQDLVARYFSDFVKQCGLTLDEFIKLGSEISTGVTPGEKILNMALLALRTTAYANGVSKLHGEVSRKMWRHIWPHVPLDEVPIGHVTNGIHTHSWISKEMSYLLLRYLGPNWHRKPADAAIWERVDKIPDVELWRVHERRRERLVAFSRRRLVDQLHRRGASVKEIDQAHETLMPEALTIGFARRFATYKRATLLFSDIERLKRIVTNSERPVQFIFAGKAHPLDNTGKELIQQIVSTERMEDLRSHFVFLENYDINIARYLVEGVDIWLNNPRRPLEASGTSGMKVVPNGGLNFSVLDGWWCEGYDLDTGWAIGAGEDYSDPVYQDEVESKGLYNVLENVIVPLFYDRGSDKLPRRWIAMMKSSMKKLSPQFSTNRMVKEYTDNFYMRAYQAWKKHSSDNFKVTRALVGWKSKIQSQWKDVKILRAEKAVNASEVGTEIEISTQVLLANLKPEDVVVQIYCGPLDASDTITNPIMITMESAEIGKDGSYTYTGRIPCDESGLFGFSVRIMPSHPDMLDEFGLAMMKWIDVA